MDPATLALITAGIGAAGSIGGGLLAGQGSGKETKTQRTQRKLIDQLISSLNGSGPYSDLFKTDESAFQKSFVDPAKSMFSNQIAPQIQQQFIAGGQQRGTGLDDQLLRAGVDLDQLLNQNYLQFQNQGKDRTQNTINSILGGGAGGTQGMSTTQSLQNAGAGYLSSSAFSDSFSDILNKFNQPSAAPRKGFENNAAYAAQAPQLYPG